MSFPETMKTVRHFWANTEGTDYFVGDIHGCRETFDDLMKAKGVNPSEGDRVFCVGDLIDRGPDSKACLDLLDEDWFFSVAGNHEALMLDALATPERDGADSVEMQNWVLNGGMWHLAEDPLEVENYADLIRQRMSIAIEVDVVRGNDLRRVGVIHSDVTSERWGNFDPVDDVWDRHRVKLDIQRRINGIDRVVAGHSIHSRPRRYGNLVNIDTGAFTKNGSMTMLDAEELLSLD